MHLLILCNRTVCADETVRMQTHRDRDRDRVSKTKKEQRFLIFSTQFSVSSETTTTIDISSYCFL